MFGRGQTSSPVGPVSVAGDAAQAPEPPTEIFAWWTGPTTVRVSWNAAEDNGSPITGYVAASSPGATEVESSTFHDDFGNLDPAASYVFRVKSRNAIGESAFSAPVIVGSYADPPAAPTNLVFGPEQQDCAGLCVNTADSASVEDFTISSFCSVFRRWTDRMRTTPQGNHRPPMIGPLGASNDPVGEATALTLSFKQHRGSGGSPRGLAH
jgi:hypothetical protein